MSTSNLQSEVGIAILNSSEATLKALHKFKPPFARVKMFGALQVLHIIVLALSDKNFKKIQNISFETQHE